MTELEPEQILKNFYVAWYNWATGSCPSHKKVFDKRIGLCRSLSAYSDHHNLHILSCIRARALMSNQFYLAGLDIVYPFGIDEFNECIRLYSMHLDPKRLQWCLDHGR